MIKYNHRHKFIFFTGFISERVFLSMKSNRLLSVCLGAAILALSLSGCAQREESYGVSSESAAVSSDISEVSESTSTENGAGANGSNSNSSTSVSGGTSDKNTSSANGSSSANSSNGTSKPTTSSAHQHTYSEKIVAPTCTQSGYTLHFCECGEQYTSDVINSLGHDYDTFVVAPTCTASGYTRYTCKTCGFSCNDDYTAALGHKYTAATVKPTCEKNGYTLNTCERCGYETASDYTSALGHSWGEWETTKTATASSDGEQIRRCSVCGKTESKSIPKTMNASSYTDEVVRLVNIERAKYGLSPLTSNSTLAEYAHLRSTEIVSNFDHVRPDGSSPLDYVMSLRGIYTSGENIAYGQSSPERVVTAWMNSPGHRANILNGKFTMIGVGCYESGGTLYWTQIFAG